MSFYLVGQAVKERQRDMLAQAERQGSARQAIALARASRRAERTGRRTRWAARKALRLRSELEQ